MPAEYPPGPLSGVGERLQGIGFATWKTEAMHVWASVHCITDRNTLRPEIADGRHNLKGISVPEVERWLRRHHDGMHHVAVPLHYLSQRLKVSVQDGLQANLQPTRGIDYPGLLQRAGSGKRVPGGGAGVFDVLVHEHDEIDNLPMIRGDDLFCKTRVVAVTGYKLDESAVN